MSYDLLNDQSYSRYNTMLNQQKGMDVGGPAPMNYSMRQGVPNSYDNIAMYPRGCSRWRHPPADVKQYPKSDRFFVTQGSGVPLKFESSFTKLPEKSMFVFARNKASPACCPSTFSTSTGCVCTTPFQRDNIGIARGGNSVMAQLNPRI